MVILITKLGYIANFEVKYVVALEAFKDFIWLGRLVADLGIKEKMPLLHCDSQSVIPVFHAKTKHIVVKYHFLYLVLDDEHLEVVKVHTDNNPIDFLTNILPSYKFAHCRELMGIG